MYVASKVTEERQERRDELKLIREMKN